jgi:hypothetical protein
VYRFTLLTLLEPLPMVQKVLTDKKMLCLGLSSLTSKIKQFFLVRHTELLVDFLESNAQRHANNFIPVSIIF